MNQAEVTNLIKEEMEKWKRRINSLGCSSEIGCVAGKAHFQMHENKLNSDILAFKNYMKDNEMDKNKTANKLSEVTIMLHDVVTNLANLLSNYGELQEVVGGLNKKLWSIVLIIFGLCVGTVWKVSSSVEKVSTEVATVNSTDVENQVSTETYMILMLEELSGKTIEELLTQHRSRQPEIEKHKKEMKK